jgi:signal transduction histidine kinase
VSHDLRNPLSSISTSAEMLEQLGAQSRVGRYAHVISRSAERMHRLIRDLLDFAQLQSGTLRVERQPFDSASLVRETLETSKPLADDKKVHLEAEPGDAEQILGDRDRVQQVLANLVDNAIKFTPPGGSVVVRVSRTDEEVRFAVADTGPGIPADELAHIWDRFWQSTPRAQPGVGLGLYIAKGLVEAHGGRIWAESSIGVGTTFSFTLPLGGSPDSRAERDEHRAPHLH